MGRKDVMEFKCDRCGHEDRIVESLGTAITEMMSASPIRPKDWSWLEGTLLCDHCTSAFGLFMDGALLQSWPEDDEPEEPEEEWVKAEDCEEVHPYGEEGWRPAVEGHEHLEKTPCCTGDYCCGPGSYCCSANPVQPHLHAACGYHPVDAQHDPAAVGCVLPPGHEGPGHLYFEDAMCFGRVIQIRTLDSDGGGWHWTRIVLTNVNMERSVTYVAESPHDLTRTIERDALLELLETGKAVIEG